MTSSETIPGAAASGDPFFHLGWARGGKDPVTFFPLTLVELQPRVVPWGGQWIMCRGGLP